MRITAIAIFFLLGFASTAVAQKEKRNADFTIRGCLGIPKTLTSQMFRTSFTGIYEGALSANIRLFDNFFMGAGYQNTLLRNNDFLRYKYFKVVIPYNTRLLCHGGFVKFGYDQFFSNKGYMTYGLNTGYMFCEYRNVNNDTSDANTPAGVPSFGAGFIQPEFAVNFRTDGNVSFSLFLSYTTLFSNFNPRAPRFNHFPEVSEKKNRHPMSWFNFGFGFNVLIPRKK
jgi:hypothetical protein